MPIEIEREMDVCVTSVGGRRVSDIVGKSPNFSNADYLFENHSIVAELKCLEENKGQDARLREKAHELYNQYMDQGKTNTLIYGEVEIEANDISPVFARDLMEMYRRPIQNVIKKANKQIRQTKERLSLDSYTGVLLLANDGHEHLNPDQVKWIVANTLRRNSYSSINAVVFFTANLKARHPQFQEDLLVWAGMERPAHQYPDAFLTLLQSAWFTHYQSINPGVPINIYQLEEGASIADMDNVRNEP